jgi:hypothetical protein
VEGWSGEVREREEPCGLKTSEAVARWSARMHEEKEGASASYWSRRTVLVHLCMQEDDLDASVWL